MLGPSVRFRDRRIQAEGLVNLKPLSKDETRRHKEQGMTKSEVLKPGREQITKTIGSHCVLNGL